MIQEIETININIASEILWFVLAIEIIFFIIAYFIFSYHWKNYGIDNNPKVFARPIFWIVALILIILMTFSIVGFEGGTVYNL